MPVDKPLTRKEALNAIRIAGFHDNIRDYIRASSAAAVDKSLADSIWHKGRQAQLRGESCGCLQCRWRGR